MEITEVGEAFKNIKQARERCQLLSFLTTDMIGKDSVVIHCTDASIYGVGRVLLQIIAGHEFIIGGLGTQMKLGILHVFETPIEEVRPP